MEKRRYERLTDSLDAEFRWNDTIYSGIIMNFSEKGLYMITATIFEVNEIAPETLLGLTCQLPSGEKIDMDCEVKWFKRKPSPFGVSLSIGMEIRNAPLKYKEFIKASTDSFNLP